VFNQMRFGFTPSVNAVFSLLLIVCLVAVTIGTWKTATSRARETH
jgi:ABC-type spermidine/putrescine transport system permease subunit II